MDQKEGAGMAFEVENGTQQLNTRSVSLYGICCDNKLPGNLYGSEADIL